MFSFWVPHISNTRDNDIFPGESRADFIPALIITLTKSNSWDDVIFIQILNSVMEWKIAHVYLYKIRWDSAKILLKLGINAIFVIIWSTQKNMVSVVCAFPKP